MYDRIADLSTSNASGKAVPFEGGDLINEFINRLGGVGAFALAQDFLTSIKIIRMRDSKLLKGEIVRGNI